MACDSWAELRSKRRVTALVTGLAAALLYCPAAAETINAALAQAYRTNPQLNAERARARSIDENVPRALSGYRPTVSATADVGYTHADSTAFGQRLISDTVPRGTSVNTTQTLFNGLRTANTVRQAEQNVLSGREALRIIEQTVLLDAATFYMNVLRDTAILDLRRRNVEVLEEQLRQTRDRFNVGEVTRTDVAQSEARLAAARSDVLVAESNVIASRAGYRRVVGSEPIALAAGSPVDRFLPNTLKAALMRGLAEHPTVSAAMYGIDVQLLQVKINEGALYPTATLQATVTQRYDASITVTQAFSASVAGQLNIPIYQGGQEYALIRQSKETLAQQRLTVEQQRDLVRQTIEAAWGDLLARKAQIQSSQAQVAAAEIALNGVREEARVGQRTTLDVLNAQQELVTARVALVTAQRDRVVASYTLLAATGRLAPKVLGMGIELYDAREHYYQVRDAWVGLRAPDGQ
jgi:outer membrane protein